jgi:hypothetical protein
MGRWSAIAVSVSLVLLGLGSPAQAGPTCFGRTPTFVGTAGPDEFTGGPGVDVIAGLGGGDTLSGGPGADFVCGGPGVDFIDYTSADPEPTSKAFGNDHLCGGPGWDFLQGASDNPGVPDNDIMRGKGGRDFLDGFMGDDDLAGGTGADILIELSTVATDDVDVLDGGPGDDQLSTEDGDPLDTIKGGEEGPFGDLCNWDSGDRVIGCELI